ncbi:hypothetical protein CVT24_007029 [Panaeolus cyanescens]|uniref:Major facilitator superfamily (MFS) profile domain-containing protein n=1 Tax=Panaeolus cyanescens TaxID=181874 RepID=A0A409YKI8_9AGAR|nr:hypothetical protein CVT24_007029 [Panaeolus cyanescens]
MQILSGQSLVYLLVLFKAYLAVAAPGPPSLDIRTTAGVFRGLSTPEKTEKWLGIPFAQPPVGNLRFRAPRPITSPPNAVQKAFTFANACTQPPLAILNAPIGEDCLHLNIWRPQGTKANAKLPVLFWIHGGAWTSQSASEVLTDPTIIIQQSVERGKPIMFVSTNYRLNTFGFLASKDVPLQDLNVGLQDQRMALNFVQDNIAAFGGDPTKVTIWGQSAGGGSVEAHMLYPAERTLFRAAIADSSTGPFKNSPPPEVYDKPGKPFARLLAATGCSAGPGAVACLQKVPFEKLMNISNAMIQDTLNGQLWEPTIAPGSFASVQASQKVSSGDFLHIPYIGGTNINEGTTFTSTVENLRLASTAEQTAAFENFIGHLVIDNSTITQDVFSEFDRLYPPNDPAEGAPFNTGDSLFDRASAWYTDQMFLSVRRHFFDHGASLQPMYAYLFGEFIPGNDPKAGVTHASELPLLFGPVPAVAAVENDFATKYRDFYINFVNDLKPGDEWPPYSTRTRQVLQLIRDNITLIPDALCGAYCAIASAQSTPDLTVRTTSGIFRGVPAIKGIEKWLGLPFAQPPVGNLRFKAPVPITSASRSVKNATSFASVCAQPGSGSEDCLYLNIFRPTGTSTGSKLPVLFWIHGGAFTSGSTPGTDPTLFIQQSVRRGKPFIFVSTAYRLNTFGFLASEDVPAQDLNAGLQDQAMALTYIQDNIAAFGGDPAKVTIWGQSAGAGGVQAHVLYPGKRQLFRAAIADSSTGPFKSDPPPSTYDKPGKPYARLLAATGCAAGRGSVACLQKVPFQTLSQISNSMISSTLNSQLWQPTIGPAGSFASVRPSVKIASGDYLHVPYIGGSNLNEGTSFSDSIRNLRLSGAAEDAAFDNYVAQLVIDNSTLTPETYDEIRRLYPANDASEGAPFNTGDSLFDRGAAWYTDQMFLSGRRHFFQHGAALQPMYAYHFREFIPGNDIRRGVTHGTELTLLYGPIPSAAQVEMDFATKFRDFYINFIHDLNPGAEWPRYDMKTKGVLQLMRDNITIIADAEIEVQKPFGDPSPIVHNVDDEFDDTAREPTPLPKFQLFIVLLVQFAEPITAVVIYPFINQFVRETGITKGDEKKTGYYAGLIESAFFFAESATVVQWGYLADRVGRRPVLLIGPLGLAFSMVFFGMSTTFWPLVVFRCLQGVFNGNIGVTKSIIAEITDETNIGNAYAFIPMTWSFGSTIAPLIGGVLSNPATRWPDTFGRIAYLRTHPYFLPCLVSGFIALVTFVIAAFGLRETLPSLVAKQQLEKLQQSEINEESRLFTEDGHPRYGTQSPEPTAASTARSSGTSTPSSQSSSVRLSALMTRPLLITLLNYAFLSFIDMGHVTLVPLIYSTSISLGGLGLDPFKIGVTLGTFGCVNSLVQARVLGPFLRKFGSRKVYMASCASLFVCIGMYPIMRFFVSRSGQVDGFVIACIVIQLSFQMMISMAYGAVQVTLVENTPEEGGMGTVNGVGQMVASAMRSISPTFASSLYSITLQKGYMGGNMVFYVLLILSIIGFRLSFLIPEKRKQRSRSL